MMFIKGSTVRMDKEKGSPVPVDKEKGQAFLQ